MKGQGKVAIDKALILIVYGDYPQDGRNRIVRKIVEKYDITAATASKVFQNIRFGAVRVILSV